MAEKENRSALQMAASIGSSPSELSQEYASLSKVNISVVLENFGKEIGLNASEWQKILAQAGLWMIDSLDQKIIDLQNKAVEQSTAIKLREMFGVPLSLLAMPVFVELEKIEINAKIDLKEEADSISQIWNQINSRLLHVVGLFLAEQINLIEEEFLAHQAALNACKKEAEGTSALAETMQNVEKQFELKMNQLSAAKNLLTKTFSSGIINLKNSVEGTFEITVFNASQQSLTINSIQ